MTTEPHYLRGRISFELGGLVDTGSVKLWLHDSGGDGEPLVFLGGTTAGHFPFDFVRPALAGYRQLTWAQRGLGPSDCPDPATSRYDLDVWSADLRDLLDTIGVERAHLWSGGFGSFICHRFAATYPERVGAVITYNDVWSGDPVMGYDRIWEVYRTIVENFGVTGIGARMLAGIFGVTDPPWFLDWEALNVEQTSRLETVEATTGYGCLHADNRADLSRIQAPLLVMRGDRAWDGSRLEESADPSLQLMLRDVPRIEVATVSDAHPAYAIMQKPEECARIARAFLERHPISA